MSYLVHSQIWMSLSGLALIAAVAKMHRYSLDTRSAAVIFCGLMWVYLLDATASHSPEDQLNQKNRLQFFRKYAAVMRFLRTLCLGVALYLTLSMNLPKTSWIFFSAAAVASWAYSVGFRGKRLKSISLNKTWIVAMAWTAGTFVSIGALKNLDYYIVSEGFVVVLLALLFFDTAILDWRDIQGDEIYGVKSIFVKTGLNWKLHFGLGLVLLAAGLGHLFWLDDIASYKLAFSYIAGFILCFAVAVKLKSAAAFSFWISAWRMSGLWLFFV